MCKIVRTKQLKIVDLKRIYKTKKLLTPKSFKKVPIRQDEYT